MERAIHSRAGIGAAACVEQAQQLDFVRLSIDQALLLRVEQGSKWLRWHGGECVVAAGEAVLIAAGQAIDVTNRLPADGAYRASWLAWDAALLTAHAERQPQRPPAEPVRQLGRLAPDFAAAFDRAHAMLAGAAELPAVIAGHRMTELLHWLDLSGASLLPPRAVTSTNRVRQLLVAAPERRWSAPELAGQLAMSEATLRRRLAAEGVSLTALLHDVRMSHALALLQSTDRPVLQIALDSGYESASRFAVRFRQRFGFAPTAVRGHRRQLDGQP